MKRTIAVLLALVMLLSLTACGENESAATESEVSETETESTEMLESTFPESTVPECFNEDEMIDDTIPPLEAVDRTVPGTKLVCAVKKLSGKFSALYAESADDMDVANLVTGYLLASDRCGSIIKTGISGKRITYNGTEYIYYGMGDVRVCQNADGTVDYYLTMRDDIKFSDGKPATIDDVIFGIYVCCDPTFDGRATVNTLPIEGMDEYLAGMESLLDLILAAGPDGSSEYFTDEQRDTCWAAIDAAGEDFVGGIFSYCKQYGATTLAEAMRMWGFNVSGNATAADCWAAVVKAYDGDVVTANSVEAGDVDLFDAVAVHLGEKTGEFKRGVLTGESAANIKGIQKTGDYSMTIRMTSFDVNDIYQLALPITPLHWYGDEAAFDYDNNRYGFTKGDLSGVLAKTATPLGCGAYTLEDYSNGVVTFKANPYYYRGSPATETIMFKETAPGDILTGVASGTLDIAAPAFSSATVENIKGYNSNGELDGDTITTRNVDNRGYGYIGINADTVLVGGDKASYESKCLRKAFATLFAVHRDAVINSYYGDCASVINYPISNTSWAVPKPGDEGYQIAYSVDVDGNPIYTEDMTEEQKYDAALQAAIGFFKAAGYTWDEASGKFTAAPKGAEMSYEVIIPADGIGEHPAYGILTAAKDELASIGITLKINDPSDSYIMWDKLDAGTQNMWVAAWGASVDPDMYQVYHSSNIVGLGGSDSNYYHIADDNLDKMIMEARTSADHAFRKSAYKECLETILDWAVEIPTYQRQNAYVISTAHVNVETLSKDMTPYWNWYAEIETLSVK